MKLAPENPKALAQKISERPLVIYGMGYVGRLIAEWCDMQNIDYAFADNNAGKNKEKTDKEVILPEEIAVNYSGANIVVASINYYNEIKSNLSLMGIDDERILSYLLFWPKKTSWQELEDSADWDAVRERARIFASWVDVSAKSVADYSAEKNFLKDLLPAGVTYYSPDYIRFRKSSLEADFSAARKDFLADVSSCLAVLMGFENPLEVIGQICEFTKKSVIMSYVTLDMLPDISFRRSINYVNDFTEEELTAAFEDRGFLLKRKETDPFDAVHTVFLFERQS